MITRTLNRTAFSKGSYHKRTLVCESGGCEKTTRENKPHCPDHLKDIDYIHNLLDVIKDQEVEQERALSQGIRAIKEDSLTVKEIVLTLSLKGQKTLNYLSRSLQLSEDVLKVYAKYLVEKRIAHSHATHRGSKTLLLVKKK